MFDLAVLPLSQGHCCELHNSWVIAVYFRSVSQIEQLHNAHAPIVHGSDDVWEAEENLWGNFQLLLILLHFALSQILNLLLCFINRNHNLIYLLQPLHSKEHRYCVLLFLRTEPRGVS